MHRHFVRQVLTLLSVGLAIATLFTGCHFFEPGIKDNQEPRVENTYDNDEPAPDKFSGK